MDLEKVMNEIKKDHPDFCALAIFVKEENGEVVLAQNIAVREDKSNPTDMLTVLQDLAKIEKAIHERRREGYKDIMDGLGNHLRTKLFKLHHENANTQRTGNNTPGNGEGT